MPGLPITCWLSLPPLLRCPHNPHPFFTSYPSSTPLTTVTPSSLSSFSTLHTALVTLHTSYSLLFSLPHHIPPSLPPSLTACFSCLVPNWLLSVAQITAPHLLPPNTVRTAHTAHSAVLTSNRTEPASRGKVTHGLTTALQSQLSNYLAI